MSARKNADKQTKSNTTRVSDDGMSETKSTPEVKNINEEKSVTPLMDSPLLPYGLEEAKPGSMSLLDDSIVHLHKLMKSVASLSQEEVTGLARVQASQVNSACNCAKNITQLLKVKLEAYKVMSKENK